MLYRPVQTVSFTRKFRCRDYFASLHFPNHTFHLRIPRIHRLRPFLQVSPKSNPCYLHLAPSRRHGERHKTLLELPGGSQFLFSGHRRSTDDGCKQYALTKSVGLLFRTQHTFASEHLTTPGEYRLAPSEATSAFKRAQCLQLP